MDKETGTKQEKSGKRIPPIEHQFKPGKSGNPKGRPLETPQQKAIRKATKELIQDYKDKLIDSLPKISPVLIAEALGGNILAIKEIHDRVMGKPLQAVDLTTGGESFFRPTDEEREKANKAIEELL